MKRKFFAAFLAVLCVSAASCGGNAPAATTAPSEGVEVVSSTADLKAAEVTEAVLAEIKINSAIEKGIDSLEAYFPDLNKDGLTDVSYYMCASGAYPDEIGVFVFSSADLAEAGKSAVESRLEKQTTTYESYTPEEMYKLEDAVIEVNGNCIFYAVTENNSRAEEIMNSFIS